METEEFNLNLDDENIEYVMREIICFLILAHKNETHFKEQFDHMIKKNWNYIKSVFNAAPDLDIDIGEVNVKYMFYALGMLEALTKRQRGYNPNNN